MGQAEELYRLVELCCFRDYCLAVCGMQMSVYMRILGPSILFRPGLKETLPHAYDGRKTGGSASVLATRSTSEFHSRYLR